MNKTHFVQKILEESKDGGFKPLQKLVRFVPLQWNRKRQYAGSKTAFDRKQKTSVVPLL